MNENNKIKNSFLYGKLDRDNVLFFTLQNLNFHARYNLYYTHCFQKVEIKRNKQSIILG